MHFLIFSLQKPVLRELTSRYPMKLANVYLQVAFFSVTSCQLRRVIYFMIFPLIYTDTGLTPYLRFFFSFSDPCHGINFDQKSIFLNLSFFTVFLTDMCEDMSHKVN
jgi:hypothetical protein